MDFGLGCISLFVLFGYSKNYSSKYLHYSSYIFCHAYNFVYASKIFTWQLDYGYSCCFGRWSVCRAIMLINLDLYLLESSLKFLFMPPKWWRTKNLCHLSSVKMNLLAKKLRPPIPVFTYVLKLAIDLLGLRWGTTIFS